ncbi:ABC transporter permease [Candidatus Dependentiae bacterium]
MLCKIVTVFSCAIIQALLSTVFAILLALPLAHFFYKFDFFGRRFFIALASMLCIMPTKLVALCIKLFFGASGFVGIILAHLMLNVPFAFYIMHAAYQKIDMTLLWLAQDCGACPWQYYKDILLPVLRPTLVSLFLLLFLLHFASFSIPLVLGNAFYHHTPEIIMYNMYAKQNGILVFICWALRLLIILPVFLMHNRFSLQKTKISSVPVPVPRAKFTLFAPYTNFWWLVYLLFIAILILCPLIALLVRAFDANVLNFFASLFSFMKDPLLGVCVLRVIANSVTLALVSGIGSVLLAFLLSVLEFKAKKRTTKNSISFITILAFVIGSVGVGILFTFFSHGKLISSFFIAVLCHIILNYAFAYRIIRAQMVLYHPDLHKTAQTFGVTCKKALVTVAFPFVLPALIKAFCVSFGLSLTEVGAGTVLQGAIGLTMPMAIRIYRKCGNQEAVIGMSLVLLGLVLIATYLFSRKKY